MQNVALNVEQSGIAQIRHVVRFSSIATIQPRNVLSIILEKRILLTIVIFSAMIKFISFVYHYYFYKFPISLQFINF